jgi:Fe-S-cluster containining protein
VAEDDALEAGDFSSWLAGMQAALAGTQDSDVPCAGCTACCTSSQFVHIAPDEADTLAHIPRALLFPAPGMPRGHVLLGYDERGHCPMLVDGRCSIYAHRPRTCRTYDCRIFPATGVEVDKPQVAERAARWRFEGDDVDAAAAVRAAAASLEVESPELNPTQRAVRAVVRFGCSYAPSGG